MHKALYRIRRRHAPRAICQFMWSPRACVCMYDARKKWQVAGKLASVCIRIQFEFRLLSIDEDPKWIYRLRTDFNYWDSFASIGHIKWSYVQSSTISQFSQVIRRKIAKIRRLIFVKSYNTKKVENFRQYSYSFKIFFANFLKVQTFHFTIWTLTIRFLIHFSLFLKKSLLAVSYIDSKFNIKNFEL